MNQPSIIRIGTRESELAVWQATHVQELLREEGFLSELVFIKSEGDIDLQTPLYEMGVQGIFTKSLDIALLNGRIDIAVHSMKDVPTQMPPGISQGAVLKRANFHDLFVPHPSLMKRASSDINDFAWENVNEEEANAFSVATIGTSSIRRKAQWLNRFPKHNVVNLRGNVNTRLQKLNDSNWQGAILAAAGLERINLRPQNSLEISWMLPAPAQGAIMVVGRTGEDWIMDALHLLNDERTALCTKIERDFLRALLGGCSTPISALAQFDGKDIFFHGNILTVDGNQMVEIEKYAASDDLHDLGIKMALELLENGGREIAATIL